MTLSRRAGTRLSLFAGVLGLGGLPLVAHALVIIHNPALSAIEMDGAEEAVVEFTSITYHDCDSSSSTSYPGGEHDYVAGVTLSPPWEDLCRIDMLPDAAVRVTGENANGPFEIEIAADAFDVRGADLPKALPYTVISGSGIDAPTLVVE